MFFYSHFKLNSENGKCLQEKNRKETIQTHANSKSYESAN